MDLKISASKSPYIPTYQTNSSKKYIVQSAREPTKSTISQSSKRRFKNLNLNPQNNEFTEDEKKIDSNNFKYFRELMYKPQTFMSTSDLNITSAKSQTSRVPSAIYYNSASKINSSLPQKSINSESMSPRSSNEYLDYNSVDELNDLLKHSASLPDDNNLSSENLSILALIVKEKLNYKMSETEIEILLSKNLIKYKNRATPFDEEVFQQSSESRIEYFNTDKSFINFMEKKRNSYLKQMGPLVNKSVSSEFFFKDMSDLSLKLFKKSKKILLTETPAPKTSNKLFQSVYKFDVADNYKKGHGFNQGILDSIKKNRQLHREIKKDNTESISFGEKKNNLIPSQSMNKPFELPLISVEGQEVRASYIRKKLYSGDTKNVFLF